MIRIYDYAIPQREVLAQCRDALMQLGYEIDMYVPLENYLVTKMRTTRVGIRKADYLIYVGVEDRIRVSVYAETRVFRRFSELGLRVGELTELEASNNLNVSFQQAIFDPISDRFARKGFTLWDARKDNREDDWAIRKLEAEKRQKALMREKRRTAQERKHKVEERGEYLFARDRDRLEAVEDAERAVMFWDDQPYDGLKPKHSEQWSLVAISKVISESDPELKAMVKDIMKDYPEYYGRVHVHWVVAPEGVPIDVQVRLNTSPLAPEDDLRYRISTAMRRLFFPPARERNRYVEFFREFEFSGSYHNITFLLSRPRLVSVSDEYPHVERESPRDTLFETRFEVRY